MILRLHTVWLVAAAPARQVVQSSNITLRLVQRRTFVKNLFNRFRGNKRIVNPLTDEYLSRKPASPAADLTRGGLAKSSVFEDETIAGPKPKGREDERGTYIRNPHSMAAALDPRPKARQRWETRMTIRDIRKRGRLTKAQLLKRQERESVSTSHHFMTSVKKLGPLARQIAGKTVDEAILQMRFSKKKAAAEVRRLLEHAKNEAIVKRGMGLGAVDGSEMLEKPVTVRTNAGKRVKISDPTTMYVEQAWVNKGAWGLSLDYRARGKVNRMWNPSTNISVVIKEEATRLRLDKERREKEARRKVWVQLPNRPIVGQRQYYSW